MATVYPSMFGNWYGVYSNSQMLTRSERDNNAIVIKEFFSSWEWQNGKDSSLLSIAAILGIMENEGGLNPQQIQLGKNIGESDCGYGLCQWTPAEKTKNLVNLLVPRFSKYGIFSVYAPSEIDLEAELNIIQFDLKGTIQGLDQWVDYNAYDGHTLTGTEFITNSKKYDIATLVKIWFYHYEMPYYQSYYDLTTRIDAANRYYEIITGEPPQPPQPDPPQPPQPPRPPKPFITSKGKSKYINLFDASLR